MYRDLNLCHNAYNANRLKQNIKDRQDYYIFTDTGMEMGAHHHGFCCGITELAKGL